MNRVQEARAVFLLLSTCIFQRGLVTSNWISFEVGLASALGKSVWLFEPILEPFLGQYDFPIPYCTHHVVYSPSGPTPTSLEEIRHIIIEGCPPPKAFTADIECPGCKLEYKVVGLTHPFQSTDCPNCKRAFIFAEGDQQIPEPKIALDFRNQTHG